MLSRQHLHFPTIIEKDKGLNGACLLAQGFHSLVAGEEGPYLEEVGILTWTLANIVLEDL